MQNKEIIIINAFPNNSNKIAILENQVDNLLGLNIPILLVSGCDVPSKIVSKVNYVLINKDNDVLEKDFSFNLAKNGINNFPYDYYDLGNLSVKFYWPNVNSTIVKNIKLGFNLAKSLGFKHALYTEDDNIWKPGSFDYVRENLDALNNNYQFGGVIGELDNGLPMIFTTFFFADVDFMCEEFILPDKKEDWYNIDIVKKYNLNLAFESCFYFFFKSRLDSFYNSRNSFNKLISTNENNNLFGWGIYDRRQNEKNLFNTFFTVLPTNKDTKVLFLFNQTHYLKHGPYSYEISIFYDDTLVEKLILEPHNYFHRLVPENTQNVGLIVSGTNNIGNCIEISCDPHKVNNNGQLIYK
jgi:hypothetical protein